MTDIAQLADVLLIATRSLVQVPMMTSQILQREAQILDAWHHAHKYERSVIEAGGEQWWRADAGGSGGGGGGGENEIFSSPPP